jgi:hypothetical protein
MERRLFKRIPLNLKAKIICDGKAYDGFIKNVSETGIGYLVTSSVHISSEFIPTKIIELNFQIPLGETLNLICEIIWFLRTSPDAKILTLGMRIIDPPPAYKEFIKNLKPEDIGEKKIG